VYISSLLDSPVAGQVSLGEVRGEEVLGTRRTPQEVEANTQAQTCAHSQIQLLFPALQIWVATFDMSTTHALALRS
jgi:hypothetical protein